MEATSIHIVNKFLFQSKIFQKCSKTVREMFSLKYGKIWINLPDKFFPERKTQTKLCTQSLDTRYYYCKDCSYDVEAGFCKDCFLLEKHADHNYTSSQQNGFCDCGMEERWNPSGFCHSHGHNREHQVLDNFKPNEEFIKFFTECFELYFSLLENLKAEFDDEDEKQNFNQFCTNYGKSFLEALSQLNTHSLYYNKLTTMLLMTKIPQKFNEEFPIIKCIIKLYGKYLTKGFKQLFMSMTTYSEFVQLFYTTLFEEINTESDLGQMIELKRYEKETFNCIETLNKLAEKDITIYSIYHEQPETILNFYVKVLKSTTNTKKRTFGIMLPIWNCLRRKGIFSIEMIPEINLGLVMKDVQKDVTLFSDMLPDFFKYLHNRIKLKYSTQENKNQEIYFFFNTIIKLMYKTVHGNQQKFIAYFKSLEISQDTIYAICFTYMKEIIVNNSKMNFITVRSIIRINCELIKPLSENKNVFQQLWFLDFEPYQIFRFSLVIVKTLLAYQLKAAFIMSQFIDDPEQVKQMQIKKQKLFKEYLYMSKRIKKRCILYLKKTGLLNFDKAGQILNQMTTYIRSNTEFIYNSPQIHENPDLLLLNTSEMIHSIRFDSQEKDVRFVTEERVFILSELFSNAFNFLLTEQTETIKKMRYQDILGLVMIDKIFLGKNHKMKSALENIQEVLKDSNVLDEKIKFILNIEKNKIEEVNPEIPPQQKMMVVEQKEEKILSAKQNAIKLKKSKINEKFAQKKLKMLEKMNEFQKNQENEQQCIICKESSQKDNELYYLGKVKNSQIFNAFCEKKSTFNVFINSCFHIVHQSCFKKYKPHYTSKLCPLCAKESNCLMPLDEGNFTLLWAQQISTLLKNKKETTNLKCYAMRTILESLVFKNGVFNVFTTFNKDEQKMNNYLFKLLKNGFQSMDVEEELLFDMEIKDLNKKSAQNEKKEMRMIEGILIETFYRKLKNKKSFVHEEAIFQLMQSISSNEFQRFATRYQQLTGFQITFSPTNSHKDISIIACPPSNMSQVRKLRQFCNCGLTSGWYCIMCEKVFCSKCHSISNHRKQLHHGYGLILMIDEGLLKISYNYQQKQFKVYENYFMEEWHEFGKPVDFQLNKTRYLETIGTWIQNY